MKKRPGNAITLQRIVDMWERTRQPKDRILIIDSKDGQLKYVDKESFVRVGTVEVGYIDEEEARDD